MLACSPIPHPTARENDNLINNDYYKFIMRRGRHRHHQGHRRDRNNRFVSNRFGFRNRPHSTKNNLNDGAKTFNRPIEKKENARPSFFDKIKPRYKIFIGLLILNLIIYVLFNPAFFFVILLDILFVIVWLWGWTKTCPRCHSYWAKRLVDRSNFGAHTEFENVSRNVVHRDISGNVIGTSSVKGIRPVTMHTIQNHWVCKYCGHSWSGRVHDVQG